MTLVRWKVILHDTRDSGPGVTTYELAHKITAASARAWATVPPDQQHFYTVSIMEDRQPCKP